MKNPIIDGVSQRFNEIQEKFAGTQAEAALEVQKQHTDSHRRYMENLNTSWEETRKRLMEAFNNYMSALESACHDTNPQNRCQEAHNKYATSVQRIYDETVKSYRDLYNDCVTAAQNAQHMTQQQAREGYRSYLRSVKDAWTQLDVDAIVDAAGSLDTRV